MLIPAKLCFQKKLGNKTADELDLWKVLCFWVVKSYSPIAKNFILCQYTDYSV